ncbi:hypothetical protein D3C71_2132380 [compost metagenome]
MLAFADQQAQLRFGVERQRTDRHGGIAVPVIVEDRIGLLHRFAGDQQIQVAEVHIRACAEILLADVAATDDRHAPVGDP